MSEHATAPVETPADVDQEFVTIHLYPRDLPYRRSGARSPQVGDVARCGWVKQVPNPPAGFPRGSCTCLMCIRLSEMAQ